MIIDACEGQGLNHTRLVDLFLVTFITFVVFAVVVVVFSFLSGGEKTGYFSRSRE